LPLNLLNWLANELGVVDKHNIRQWLIRLFVPPSGQAARREASLLLALFRVISSICALFFLVFKKILSLVTNAIAWLWERLIHILPTTNHAAVGRQLEGWLDTKTLRHPALFWLLILSSIFFFWLAVTTPFNWSGQLLFLMAIWATTMFIRRIPGNLPTLILIALSVLASCRYGWWRATHTIPTDTGWETFLAIGLFLAEVYTWLVLMLGYVQTAWPLKRQILTLPENTHLWPTVDVFIPTYNEPLNVVKPTVLAATGIEWPREKINIYILDDGKRDEFREFAEQAGVGYIVRPDNSHAKAGNLNHALKITQSEFVAIFDCDHLPVRSFLKSTMGWFLKDSQCAMVQTPHHFFSPDPFERNLDTFRRVPNEGALFYGLIQDGNDFWNASFFCGSCAVLRRGPLEEVGGVAVETVTEDAHTALKLHRLGYTTAYINIPQAAGLATESLSGHIGQRIRWARGMAQIFRIDNPFLGKGLSFFQRICYSNAVLHFFYGIPRLIFLTAPLSYLYFQIHIITASAVMITLYVLPHILQANLANAHIHGPHRHSFWAELYESVLAWYITLPTAMAVLNPSAAKFNVTVKGGLIEREYFDWTISKPYLILVALNVVGLGLGLFRLLFWNTFEVATVSLNLIWTVYNLLILGAAIGVASETRQVRESHRVSAQLPVDLLLADGNRICCYTEDYSITGLGLILPQAGHLPIGERIFASLWLDGVEYKFPALVVLAYGDKLGINFDNLNISQQTNLIQCTFARAEAWDDWTNQLDSDHPMQGLKEIANLGLSGYRNLWQQLANLLVKRDGSLLSQSEKNQFDIA
jgi:cellulose synthase (UDP-forming)